MQPLSAATRAALTSGNAQVSVLLTLLSGGAQVASYAVQDAKVSVDRGSSTRRRATVTLNVGADLSAVPQNSHSSTAPFGNEMYIRFGIALPGQRPDAYISMGVFPLVDTETSDTGADLTVSLNGYDRSWVVDRYKFKAPYVITQGANVQATVQAILDQQAPGLPRLNMPPTGYTLPAAAFKENDGPWSAITTLAFSVGMEAFFDVFGVPTLRPIPDPLTQTPVWTYAEGVQGSAPLTLHRKLTRDGVSNDFIVVGSGTGTAVSAAGTPAKAPVRSEAEDTNSSSPTYVSGKFGDVPHFTTSNLVSTQQQATDAAANQLAAARGSVEELTITVKPNPAFDIDDVITVQRARAGVYGNYVVDSISTSAHFGTPTSLTMRNTVPV